MTDYDDHETSAFNSLWHHTFRPAFFQAGTFLFLSLCFLIFPRHGGVVMRMAVLMVAESSSGVQVWIYMGCIVAFLLQRSGVVGRLSFLLC